MDTSSRSAICARRNVERLQAREMKISGAPAADADAGAKPVMGHVANTAVFSKTLAENAKICLNTRDTRTAGPARKRRLIRL
jgi:hypothetical protein